MDNSIEINKVLKFFEKLEVSKINQEELEAVVTAWDRVTPLVIEELKDDDVFVFGSNTNGCHSARASKTAMERFGAVDKKGEGLFGRSYALPTTEIMKPCDTEEERQKNDIDVNYRKFDKEEIKPYVDRLLKCVKAHPEKNFYITRVACGFSDKRDAEIAPLFSEFVKCKNVYLPKLFLYEIFGKGLHIISPTELAIVKSGGPDSFVKQLDEQLSMYIRWVAKHRCENEYDVEIVDMVERVCSAIASAVAMYYRGLPAEAYGKIADLFDSGKGRVENEYLNIEDYLSPVTDEQVFYRMRRETDSWKRKEIGKDDMYHIPFGLRGMVTTQRYSIPGFPCMYIGCSEEGCWEELGRPNKNECVLSQVNIRKGKSFRALDLTIPTADSWKTMDENLLKAIKFFPFVIACTFKPCKVSDTFKPEYVIPQLLLQYVKDYGYRCNRCSLDADKQIYGVKYTSVHVDKKKLGDASNQYVNYVIPVTSIDNDYCSRIKDTFEVTEPKMC